MFYQVGLDETTALHLDRYITEKVLSVISLEIDKEKWSDESILLLKTYQNELRAGIKDLGILHNRHTEQLAKIYEIVTGDIETAKIRLELSNNPVQLLEERVAHLEKRLEKGN